MIGNVARGGRASPFVELTLFLAGSQAGKYDEAPADPPLEVLRGDEEANRYFWKDAPTGDEIGAPVDADGHLIGSKTPGFPLRIRKLIAIVPAALAFALQFNEVA